MLTQKCLKDLLNEYLDPATTKKRKDSIANLVACNMQIQLFTEMVVSHDRSRAATDCYTSRQ